MPDRAKVEKRSRYEKAPSISVGAAHHAWSGVEAYHHIAGVALGRSSCPLVVIDTYPGVDMPSLVAALTSSLPQFEVIDVEQAAAKSHEEVELLIGGNLTEDRVFGVMSHLTLDRLYDSARLRQLSDRTRMRDRPTVVVGWGAALVDAPADVLVLADMARWEIQRRQRAGAANWRADNANGDYLSKVKRGFFVEWRIADRHKVAILDRTDFILDTNGSTALPKLISIETFWAAMDSAVATPFRVVPFFDPGVWGGQWLREVCGLGGDEPNYAWCFDCVPEENSLLLSVDGQDVEIPSLDLVLTRPRELLGERTFARFGPEFPIRFDLLDTMQGGNLSLQVHPLTGYIQDTFGMHYTQDESYYILEADEGAVVYLGIRNGTDPEEMLESLGRASSGEVSFAAERFVNTFPVKKHDHFSIPAGTVHCSGANTVVLEISATPYIFTFKMWDWDRIGLDGRPRPIHLDHARHNIQWDRDTDWTRDNLVGQTERIASGDGWVEERTGLHPYEFIEVRRHRFAKSVAHDTEGTLNVLNLVEGAEAIIESPTEAFEPFVVHYAETFIVPAAVGRYTIRPSGTSRGKWIATIKASVRDTRLPQGDRQLAIV